jgi:hypothetical protein
MKHPRDIVDRSRDLGELRKLKGDGLLEQQRERFADEGVERLRAMGQA